MNPEAGGLSKQLWEGQGKEVRCIGQLADLRQTGLPNMAHAATPTTHRLDGHGASQGPQVAVADPGELRLHRLHQVWMGEQGRHIFIDLEEKEV